jgi:ribonuclease HI
LAKKKKYYAVVNGCNPGIYTEWKGQNGAQAQVIRFSGALFQGFETKKEAEEFMKQQTIEQPEIEKTEAEWLNDGKIIIYTDGGCINNPGPGGYGVVLKNKRKTKELSGGYRMTTNNRMELMACIVGLSALKKTSSFVILYSDSKYVVDGITKGWAKRWQSNGWMRTKTEPAINPDLWGQLLELCGKHDVRFQWVRGHAGNESNERCDELASKAASDDELLSDDIYEMNINKY